MRRIKGKTIHGPRHIASGGGYRAVTGCRNASIDVMTSLGRHTYFTQIGFGIGVRITIALLETMGALSLKTILSSTFTSVWFRMIATQDVEDLFFTTRLGLNVVPRNRRSVSPMEMFLVSGNFTYTLLEVTKVTVPCSTAVLV